MDESKEKRMIANTGYEVMHAVCIGDREILVADNMASEDGNCYLVADFKDNGFFGEYSRCEAGADYFEIMSEFTARVNAQIEAVRAEISETDYQSEPITGEECRPHDYGQDLNGRIVAIRADVLRPEWRRGDRQLVLVDGGNGAKGSARGGAVFCYYLYNGEHTRFERSDVLGEIKDLPGWAKERFAVMQSEREAKETPTRKAEPETVAGYAITKRLKVGEKEFVLGENPAAPSPFVTWARYSEREGYDHGNYFASRQNAMANLSARADRERENRTPDRAKRSRDDAR
jgi:hypothetical protein